MLGGVEAAKDRALLAYEPAEDILHAALRIAILWRENAQRRAAFTPKAPPS